HAAQTYTVFSHGGLTPWRIILKDSGDVSVIGYALPQVEMLDFQRDERMKPTEDSFRYCPPERIRSEPEDLSSDLFTLGLIAFELMTLMPMYDGTVDSIRQRAIRGDASQQIYAARDVIPIPVAKLLERTLQPNRDTRFHSGREFLDAVDRLLDDPSIEGVSLSDLLKQVKQQANSELAPLPNSDQDFRTALLSRENLLQNREEYSAQKPIREEVILGNSTPALNISENSSAQGINRLYESQSVITTSGSSWKPVDRQKSVSVTSNMVDEIPDSSAEPERLKSGDRKSGASNILKMLRESQRSMSVEGLAASASESPAPEVPSFVKNIKRKRNRAVSQPEGTPQEGIELDSEAVEGNVALTSNASPEQPTTHIEANAPEAQTADLHAEIKSVLSTSSTDSTAIHPRQKKKKKSPKDTKQIKTSHSAEDTAEAKVQAANIPSPNQAQSETSNVALISEQAPQIAARESIIASSISEISNAVLNSPRFAFAPLSVNSKAAKRYGVQRNRGDDPIRFKAAPNNTTAEFVNALLTNRLIATRVGLDGQILGWYRFQQ
ncbi:MAG: hypothetical protein VX026_11515, partial [Myxococcota bacterium]|nr:hypothetical protein [Myxococcota bacterium]